MRTMNTTNRLASLLALTAALAGCGGASDKASTPAPSPAPTPAPAPVPTAPIGVGFVQPGNNVLEPNASEPLSVNVTVNGSQAPNGTTTTFTVSPASAATLAPVAPTTVGGVASTTLTVSSLPPTATFQTTATAVSSSNTATDSLTYYVRPAHKPLQVLVPAYFSATGTTSPWVTLTGGATSYPDVKITAIANPSSGVLTADTKEDTDLTKAIKAFQAVAGTSNRVIGYVGTTSTSSGALSLVDIKATITNYIRL